MPAYPNWRPTAVLLCLLAFSLPASGQESPPPAEGAGTAPTGSAADREDGDMAVADMLLKKGLITLDEWEQIRLRVRRRQAGAQAGERADEQALQESLQRMTARDPADDTPGDDGPVVKLDHGGILVTSPDGDYSWGFGGRLQMDAAAFDDEEVPLGNGTEARRFRMRMSGHAQEWRYKLEVDFSATGSADVTDATLSTGVWDGGAFTAGHQKVPFSQQSMTSSNWQVFQERSLGDTFIDTMATGRRRMGVTTVDHGENHHFAVGLFGEGLDDDGTTNEDWGAATRYVAIPVAEADEVLALGGSLYMRDLSSNSALRFSDRAEAHIAGTRLVDTGVIAGANELDMANAELTWISGPFHAEAEYFDVNVGRNGGMDAVAFESMHAQVGWFLTGETRPFSTKGARFERIRPEDEDGAWEIAARYSAIDLSDGNVRGGREEDLTFGVNWWMNASMAMRFNYVYAHVLETAQSLGLASAGQHVNAVTMRFQTVF